MFKINIIQKKINKKRAFKANVNKRHKIKNVILINTIKID